MLRSFKLKIALSSVLLSGTLLLAFGLFFIRTSRKIGIDRTDRELRALVDADLRKVQPSNHWQRFDDSLKNLFGEHVDKQFILKVSTRRNERLFESPQWEEEIGTSEIRLPPPVAETAPATIDPERDRPFNKRQKERPPAPAPLEIGQPAFTTIGTWRVVAIRNPEVLMQLGISLEPLNAEIERFRNALLLTIPGGLLLLIGAGWILAQLALRPVNAIARTAANVSAAHLDERIPATGTDREFRQLIDVINDMLNRLEASFRQAARFSADAAHELKTPLTILQGELEHAMQSAPDGSVDQRTYKELLDEVQRLKSIIRKLLLLSQADAGRLPLHIEPIDFTALIGQTCGDITALDPALEVQADLQPGVTIQGDAGLLTQVVQNLAGNAVKFCRGESPVSLSLKTEDGRVFFRISNRGEPIGEADRERIFERFYRATRKAEGSGLGLSLAREIARAHGGSLDLVESASGLTTFRLVLPMRITEP